MKDSKKNSEMDLSFLKDPFYHLGGKVTLEDFKAIAEGLRRRESSKVISERVKRSAPVISGIRRELIIASREGLTLEEYWRKGRPFSRQKKVIA